MRLKEKSVMFVATGCHVGNTPFAPGTFGTLIGLPICFILSVIDVKIAILYIGVFIVVAIFIAHEAEKILNKTDPGSVVIDEIAGIMVALAGLPFNAVIVVAGVIIFRLLDIFKPFPIKQI
jgi:phosphatidylglycerophosphatase A